jgi:uncharacterized protein (TIGR02271 family)
MTTTPSEWLGREIATSEGMRYGRLDELFVGQQTGEPEFGIVTVPRAGAEGTKRVAVPMQSAAFRDGVVVLPFDPARVKAAPEVQADVQAIPPESGRRVREFFGLSDELPTQPLPSAAAGHPPTEPMPPVEPGPSVVLSEEELDVTTETRAAERVRLRKQVVTEEVTVTLEVRREELVIERETIPRDSVAAADATAFEDHAETVIVLHAEEPVIGRRVVPVERVRLRKDMVVEQTTINEPVRKERADVEHIDIEQERPA